jgi:hypothetical protein
MLDIVKDTLYSLLPYALFSPIVGFLLMHCLFELFDAMEVKIKKNRKWKCWTYVSVLVFFFATLMRVFAS